MIDVKKQLKEEYLQSEKPILINVSKTNYLAVRGTGNPNDENGEYMASIGYLYGIIYTIKMSYKTNYKIKDFDQFVAPPLEGFWWQEGIDGVDYLNKSKFSFISIIRLPSFVTKEVFEWAKVEAEKKKKTDFSKVEYLEYEEGLCVQCMHKGSFDDEPKTIERMHKFMSDNGYLLDISDQRYHHEIYLSDARKVQKDKLKTIIRHPIKKNIK